MYCIYIYRENVLGYARNTVLGEEGGSRGRNYSIGSISFINNTGHRRIVTHIHTYIYIYISILNSDYSPTNYSLT